MATRGSQVREFSGINGALLATLNPFGPFTGGARVAAVSPWRAPYPADWETMYPDEPYGPY